MGYRGEARGLLDPQVNLAYAVPYLANAYMLADGNEDAQRANANPRISRFASPRRCSHGLPAFDWIQVRRTPPITVGVPA